MTTFKQFLNEDKTVHIDNEYGSLAYGWNDKLEDEEFEGYIPSGYSKKVLELKGLFAEDLGKGYGDKLMKIFLNSKEAKAAELIFLDPVPGIGKFFSNGESPDEIINKLRRFYAKYGFKSNPKSNRMWLVKKGSIPIDKLPT